MSILSGTVFSFGRKLYSRGAKGELRYWHYEIDGDKWRGHSGIVGGKDTVSGWITSKPKNVGKKNETTAAQQALAEAHAEFEKKLAREYRATEGELDSVPPSPMLAQKYKDLKKALRFPGGIAPGVFVQPKLDGIRMLTSHKHDALSRDYQPFGESVDHIREALAMVLYDNRNIVFDGELYNHVLRNDFNTITSLVRTEKLLPEQRHSCRRLLQYHVYDLILLDRRDAPFERRRGKLIELAGRYDLDFLSPVTLVETIGCTTREDVDAAYERWLAEGYEGQIVRTNEPYEIGTRSWSLMKRKEFQDIEVSVIRLIMGEGNWAGIPKAIEYMLPGDKRDESGNRPKASIKGSQEFCRSLSGRRPKGATIRFFALTPGGIPRFPVATDFHDTERTD